MQLRFAPILLVAVAGCGGAGSAGSPSTGSLAFVVNRAGFNEIWTMRATGANRRRLTERAPRGTDASGNSQPAWSPSGKEIAYVGSGTSTVEDEHALEIYVMGSDGRNKRRLTFNDVPDWAPSWSPDGNEIVFSRAFRWGRGPHPAVAVYAMRANGTEQWKLARESPNRGAIFLTNPAWSPDGKTIAYQRSVLTEQGGESAIYVMDPDGGNRRRIAGDAADPSWSPDGSRIAFVTERDRNGRCLFHDCAGYAPEIYVMRADGSHARRVTRSPQTDVNPTWSSDGLRIAFARIADESSDYEIFSIRPDGSDLRQLTENMVWDYQPTWQPR
ncbi:MAG TPA: hypothetical protein VF895_01860 [Gaiellaceae bacterium]